MVTDPHLLTYLLTAFDALGGASRRLVDSRLIGVCSTVLLGTAWRRTDHYPCFPSWMRHRTCFWIFHSGVCDRRVALPHYHGAVRNLYFTWRLSQPVVHAINWRIIKSVRNHTDLAGGDRSSRLHGVVREKRSHQCPLFPSTNTRHLCSASNC